MKTILGIIFFAIATMIVYSWGYVKEQRAPYELAKKLNNKAEKRIIESLKSNDSMTKKEITKILKGLTVSKFGSRRKLVVQDPNKLAKSVLDSMIKKEIIEINHRGKENTYEFKNS